MKKEQEISSWLDEDSKDKIQITEFALNEFAKSQAILPSKNLKATILDKISQLNQKRKVQGIIDLTNPPLLSEDSNLQDWILATKDMQPPTHFKDIHLEPILQNENVEMFIAWVTKMVPEEVHDDLLESFMLLEGSCTCNITNPQGELKIVHMQAGDYITMNIGETHDVHITSEKPAKAVLQWLKIAA